MPNTLGMFVKMHEVIPTAAGIRDDLMAHVEFGKYENSTQVASARHLTAHASTDDCVDVEMSFPGISKFAKQLKPGTAETHNISGKKNDTTKTYIQHVTLVDSQGTDREEQWRRWKAD